MINLPYATDEDIERCKKIVASHLSRKGSYSDSKLNDITLDIMNISYAKGGCYSDKEIEAYAEGYMERFIQNNDS